MTITTEDNIAGGFVGNGSTTAFATPAFQLNADIRAILVTDATGAETLWVLDTDYTLSGAGNPAGGTLTATTAPASGTTLYITVDPAITQQAINPNAAAVEDALDKLTQIVLQQGLAIDRAIKLPEAERLAGSVASTIAAGLVANRAFTYLGFDDNGAFAARDIFGGPAPFSSDTTYDPETHFGRHLVLDVGDNDVELELPDATGVKDGIGFWVRANSTANAATITVAETGQLRSKPFNGFTGHVTDADTVYLGYHSSAAASSLAYVYKETSTGPSHIWQVIGIIRDGAGDDYRVTSGGGGGGGGAVDSVAGQTGDVTAGQLVTAIDGESNVNFLTDAERTKLTGIETAATADQTGSEIVSAINTELGSSTWQGGGGGSLSIEEDDSEVAASVDTINFEGSGIGSITDEGSGKVTVNIALPASGSGDAVRVNVNSFAGATFTDKLQNAVDSGEPIDIPAGAQTLDDVITGPAGGVDIQGAGDGLRHAGGTLLTGVAGGDIFRWTNTSSVQARPGGQNTISMSRMGLRLNPDGNNTRTLDRSTATGYGVGIAAIGFIRGDWPTETTGTRSISNAWNHSHTRIRDITFDVLNGSAIDHGCAGFHSQGVCYGSRFEDLDSGGGQSSTRRGVHSLLTIAQPYVHRVSADAGTDRLTASSGTNQFLNDQQVVVRTHDATGTQPGGIDFDTVYFVVNRNGTSFQISTTQGGGAVNITSAGSGNIYAILVGSAGAVFSPDEVHIGKISHYNGKMGVSVCNPERLVLTTLTSYGIETILELPGLLSTTSRTQAVGFNIGGIYSESPQATAGNANSPVILIDSDGGWLGYCQVRGADTGDQPIYDFRGNDLSLMNIDGRSSFSQGGVDLRISATHSMAFGQIHASSTATIAGDCIGSIREAGDTGFFLQRNFV